MNEIKKIYKKNIPSLLANDDFWNHSFLSATKHRLFSHYKNPNLGDEDLVLLLSYIDGDLVGYMGLFTDKIMIDGVEKKMGWLSTWWVHPKTKGTGIGKEILNTMYEANAGQIGISQFTPSAKRVYDKSGLFTTLKDSSGVKAVLRSNFSFLFPTIHPSFKKINSLFQFADDFLNFFINIKLRIQSVSISKRLKDVKIEYLNILDNDVILTISRYNKTDLSIKTPEFFEWLKAYPWVLKAPLLDATENDKYEFSMYDSEFELHYVKVIKGNECIGFLVIQKRNYVSKVLFTYFDQSKHASIMADVIKWQNINQDTREIICYDEAICKDLNKSAVFLYKRKKLKESIISKTFGKTDFSDIRVSFGDGDCCFA